SNSATYPGWCLPGTPQIDWVLLKARTLVADALGGDGAALFHLGRYCTTQAMAPTPRMNTANGSTMRVHTFVRGLAMLAAPAVWGGGTGSGALSSANSERGG